MASGTIVKCFVFALQGQWDMAKPFPWLICVCVVRRDGGSDAVVSGLDRSSAGTQPGSLYFSLPLSVCLPLFGWRGQDKLNVGSRSERKTDRGRSLLCSIGDSALASLQFTCTGLPKAAASQATLRELDSDWMGGAPLAQQPFIG